MNIENFDFNEDFYNELYDKKYAFYKHRKKIKTVIIGGSHINHGINPKYFDDMTLNFGFTSIDFFAMWNVVNIYCEKLPKLKNIVIRISVFCPGYDLSKVNEKWRCLYYKHILGVPYDVDSDREEFTEYEKSLSQRKIDDDFLGYKKPTWFGPWDAKERYNGHLKNFYRNDSQLKYLSLINNWCIKHKKRLICIIAPHRSDYVAASSKDVMEQLENYVHKYAPWSEFYSFFDDPDFIYDDFGDTDHLNEQGAKKFSMKLNKIIKYKHLLKLLRVYITSLPLIRRFLKLYYVQ